MNSKNTEKRLHTLNFFLILFSVINIGIFVSHELGDWKNANKIYDVVNTMEEESIIYSNSPQSALFISLITGKKVYTVPVFSDYEDEIYQEHMLKISYISMIDASTIYCFYLSESEPSEVTLGEKLGDYFEENALTLYRYYR